jgi:septal ring factor EnvC (AmiA/AmiB activator)
MDEREAVNRSVAEHLAQLRERLAAGKSEIARLRASVDETHEHLAGMSRWIEQTDHHLAQERARLRGEEPSGGSD